MMGQLAQKCNRVGYAWVAQQLGLPDFLGDRVATRAPCTRLTRTPEGGLLVPSRSAPGETLLDHLLFALKHEGVELYVLACGLKRVTAAQMQAAVDAAPNGRYVRTAAYLWEGFNRQTLSLKAQITAPYHPIFDPAAYIVGHSRRSPKWRVDFNGLGDLRFCPVVRRTDALQALLQANILDQVQRFIEGMPPEVLDRALGWAYLSETEGSFSLEGEVPSSDKSRAFARLLKHADDPRPLDEATLCEWQRLSVSNALDHAFQYRTEQNRLQRGRGAAGVRYVPPAPAWVPELMEGLLQLANHRPDALDPLIHAAVVSFGFVFIHPFMDGNGRLSRFLVHHCLGQSGALPRGFVLPISVAMKRHEAEYLQALQSFSKPARELCDVRWAGAEEYDFRWLDHAKEAFQYMDLTAAAEWTLRMAEAALQEDLLREAQWLTLFDRIYDEVSARHDVRSADLSALITIAIQNGGTVSAKKRRAYAERVPADVMHAIDEACSRYLPGGLGA